MMSLLERARREGTPLIDGDQVTFVWHGDGKPPLLAGDWTNWNEPEAIHLTETEPGVWTHTTSFRRDAYLEYAFFHAFGSEPDTRDERAADPFNRRPPVWNGIRDYNYTLHMPDYMPTDLTQRRRSVPRGALTRHMLPYPARRTVWLYQPPVEAPVPLIVVWDGTDYARRARLPIIVDNLIEQKRIQPVALAMIHHGGRTRMMEYFASEWTTLIMSEFLMPFAASHLNLIDVKQHPGSYGVLGASMGGLMALFTGLTLPHIFGRVISQSGAFDFQYGGRTEQVLYEMIRHFPRADIRIWQDVGLYEWLLNGNRRMQRALLDRGYPVTYREFAGGHNYAMWADMLGEALITHFG
ncbi:esterase family protein [Anaerolineae bacterium CFX9]|nr:esterase family protein [Anaerolineae bacterium CFX9]